MLKKSQSLFCFFQKIKNERTIRLSFFNHPFTGVSFLRLSFLRMVFLFLSLSLLFFLSNKAQGWSQSHNHNQSQDQTQILNQKTQTQKQNQDQTLGITQNQELIQTQTQKTQIQNQKMTQNQRGDPDQTLTKEALQNHETDVFVINSLSVSSPHSSFNLWTNQYLKKFQKKKYTPQMKTELRDSLSLFWAKGGYHSAHIDSIIWNESRQIVIQVRNPVEYNVQIYGVSPLLIGDLNSTLSLKTFSSSNPNFHYEISQKIKSFYLDLGYARVDVRSVLGKQNYFKQSLTFEVSEGSRIKINSFRFIGQFNEPNQHYEKLLLKFSPKLIRSKYFNRGMVEEGIRNMITSLWNQGYLKAQGHLNRISYSKDRSSVDIFILFFEGTQTFLNQVEFLGNKELSSEKLRDLLDIQPGVPLALSDIEAKSQKLISLYLDKGFLQMRLMNFGPQMVEYSEDFTQATLKFEIQEGPKIQVASIEIQGHQLTQGFVIRNELDFKVGDTLTRVKVKDTQDRLYLTGLFRDIQIHIEPEISEESQRHVKVKVLEKEPGLFHTALGAHNERGLTFRGFVGTSYNNLLGTGRALSARIEGQYNMTSIPFFERSIQAFYLEPYLFNTRTRGRVGVSRSFLITDFNNNVASEANRTNYTIEQNVTPRLLLRWQLYEVTSFRDFAINSNRETNKVGIGSTLLSFEWDHRDHLFNPTQGFFTNGLMEYAHPDLLGSSWVQFYKTQIAWTQYQRLFDSQWILAVNGRWGQIWNDTSNPNAAIPYDKVGFFLGGQVNLRGFTLNEIFPNTMDLGGTHYRLNGSAEMRLIKTELRIPLWESLGTALFYDIGDIQFSGNQYNSGLRQSAGLAFRYQTPVGAVSLEYAWKLSPRSSRGESPAALHFAIGSF
jgi:outer membrane protein insertion porin family